jgi:hypothetical protein
MANELISELKFLHWAGGFFYLFLIWLILLILIVLLFLTDIDLRRLIRLFLPPLDFIVTNHSVALIPCYLRTLVSQKKYISQVLGLRLIMGNLLKSHHEPWRRVKYALLALSIVVRKAMVSELLGELIVSLKLRMNTIGFLYFLWVNFTLLFLKLHLQLWTFL